MQAPIEVSRRSGEVFSLDILSHRMSAIAIFQQLSLKRRSQRTSTRTVFDEECAYSVWAWAAFLGDITIGSINYLSYR
jgi:hypothetical protein